MLTTATSERETGGSRLTHSNGLEGKANILRERLSTQHAAVKGAFHWRSDRGEVSPRAFCIECTVAIDA